MSDLFTLRPAREGDWELINYYAYREGMDAIPSLENVTVAANGDDDCVGFCRLAFSEAGIAHVNPVVDKRAMARVRRRAGAHRRCSSASR